MTESVLPGVQSYRSRVAALCHRQPCLLHLSKFLSHSYPTGDEQGQIACLEFYGSGMVPGVERLSVNELALRLQRASLHHHKNEKGQSVLGRILILEELTAQTIEMVGSALNVDPLFFAAHLHTSRTEQTVTSPPVKVLPSRAWKGDLFHIRYSRPLVFYADTTHATPRKLLCKANVRRKASVSNSPNGVSIGTVQREISILTCKKEGECWLCERESLFLAWRKQED